MTSKALALLAVLGAGAALAPPTTQEQVQERVERLSDGRPVAVGPDRVAAGMEVTLRDSVPGDAMVTGGEVAVGTPVGGDVLGAGGIVGISGAC